MTPPASSGSNSSGLRANYLHGAASVHPTHRLVCLQPLDPRGFWPSQVADLVHGKKGAQI